MSTIADITETVYEHTTGDNTFTITAAEQWSKTMVKRLKKRYPDEVDIRYINEDGSMLVHMPFSWMRVSPKRKLNLTDEQREERRVRMMSIVQSQNVENEQDFKD